jgi:hypothetical protein
MFLGRRTFGTADLANSTSSLLEKYKSLSAIFSTGKGFEFSSRQVDRCNLLLAMSRTPVKQAGMVVTTEDKTAFKGKKWW